MIDGKAHNTTLFEDKHVLVTGGTGSLGSVLIKRILTGEFGSPRKVTVFSRDEAKQYSFRLSLRHLMESHDETPLLDYNRILAFRIGDVRSFSSVTSALRSVDIVFHTAALKQVPSCEYFPQEAVETNIAGAENIVRSIETHDLPVETVVGISTDKACKPVNVLGMTKALQERLFVSANLRKPSTRFICARYGNVLASRGSVIPLFHSQIKASKPVTITTFDMSRFLLSLNSAVDTIIGAYRLAQPGEIFVPIVPSANIANIARALIGNRNIELIEMGIRPGEKRHEILISEEEATHTTIRENFYAIRPTIPEVRALGSSDVTTLDRSYNNDGEYSSINNILTQEETRKILSDNGLLIEQEPNFTDLFGA